MPYAEQLIRDGFAYYAFDSSEELENMRQSMKEAGVSSPQYNAITRTTMQNSLSLSNDEVKKRISQGDPYVIRIKMPRNEEIKLHDIIRGWVVVNTNNLDDLISDRNEEEKQEEQLEAIFEKEDPSDPCNLSNIKIQNNA